MKMRELKPIKLWCLAGASNLTACVAWTRADLIRQEERRMGGSWAVLRKRGFLAVQVWVTPVTKEPTK